MAKGGVDGMAAAVRDVFVVGVYRNNAAFWRDCGGRLWEDVEAALGGAVRIHYALYENDSIDGTAEALRAFASGRADRAWIVSERDVPGAHSGGAEFSHERAARIAGARNRLWDRLRVERPTWFAAMGQTGAVVFVYDADVLFSATAVHEMICALDSDPRLVLVGPYAKQADPYREGTPSVLLPVLGRCSVSGHYYDTYAVVAADDRMHYARCVMPRCRVCDSRPPKNRYRATPDATTGWIDVRSCFGGLVAVRGTDATAACVRWRTTEMLYGQLSLCEHIYFCDMLRAAHAVRTGQEGRVVIATTLPVYWVKDWPGAAAKEKK